MSENIVLKVILQHKEKETELSHGQGRTALQTMREGGIVLPSLCDGLGKCGRCMVRFRDYAPLPTQTDRALLSPEQLRSGYRLACSARPVKDCVIETEFEMRERIQTLTESKIEDARPAGGCMLEDGGETVIAADIGTTTIAMELRAVASGRVLDTYTCLNPQRSYGTDVISRIRAGMEGHGEKLQRLVRDALLAGQRQLAETAEKKQLGLPDTMVIACNTVMGHIFMGYPLESLGQSPFQPVNTKAVSLEWEGMKAWLVPGISAFVGGDIIAGLYACGLCNGEEGQEETGWLFIDLGTNAEMAMGLGGRIVATAAAAGPAFEGRGRDGALGAERIAAIAQLLEQGLVDETGLLQEPYFEQGIEVMLPTGKKVFIAQEDIRDIQMAKAAVRAGIHFMAAALMGGRYGQIERVYVAGGLGFYLDKRAAARIGLIPLQLEARCKAAGNTSLAGAALLGRNGLRGDRAAIGQTPLVLKKMEEYAERVEAFNLAESPGFEQAYIGYMDFPSN